MKRIAAALILVVVAGCNNSTPPQPGVSSSPTAPSTAPSAQKPFTPQGNAPPEWVDRTRPVTPPGSAPQTASTSGSPSSAPTPAHDYAGWNTYAPAEAGFEIKFPSDPVLNTTPSGGETIHVAGIQRPGIDGLSYACQWIARQEPFPNDAFKTGYLRGHQEALLRGLKGNLVEEKELSLDGALGREFTISVSPGNLFRTRVYVTDTRVINLQVAGKDQEAVHSRDAEGFFNSLKIATP